MRLLRSRSMPIAMLLGLLLLASACSVVPQPHVSHRPITSQETNASKVAEDVLQTLKGNGLPVGESFTFNANTDPDHLLGAPRQYIAKVTFRDTHAASVSSGANITVDDGGCIEVFTNLDDAQATKQYIAQANQAGALFTTEYDYWRGVVLLRVSSQLTPDEAHQYRDVLNTYPLLSTPQLAKA